MDQMFRELMYPFVFMHDGITLTLAGIIGLYCLLVYFSGGERGGPEVGGGYSLLEDHVSSTLNS